MQNSHDGIGNNSPCLGKKHQFLIVGQTLKLGRPDPSTGSKLDYPNFAKPLLVPKRRPSCQKPAKNVSHESEESRH